ncbi:MAG: glycosyltransferase [Chloroflexi bacterium]|nr:glycosyltransferase [Chloroflexota bacterium]
MKILIVTNQYPSAARPDGNPTVINQERGLKRLGVESEVLFLQRETKGQLVYLEALLPLFRKWRGGKFDLLHVQFGGIQALLSAFVARRRAVITFHGTDLYGLTFSPGGSYSRRTRLSRGLNTWCSRRAARMAGGVIVVAANMLPFLPKDVQTSFRVIPIGVDYDLFQPQPVETARSSLGLDAQAKIILFVDVGGSSLKQSNSRKRLDIAMAVEEKVRNHEPSARLLILAGEPHWRVPLFVNAADCLLLTSDVEASPSIVREALAVNLPIVSVDVGDVASCCRGVANCQIISRDVDALAEAVLRAFRTGRDRGGRELKRAEIDNERTCQQIYAFFQEVLARSKEKPASATVTERNC